MNEIVTREQIVEDIKKNLEALNGHTVSSYAVLLSALLGTISEELALAEMEYFKKWEEIRLRVDTNGRADKVAKATPEYYQRRLVELKFKSTTELIQALKRRLNVLSEEAQGRY